MSKSVRPVDPNTSPQPRDYWCGRGPLPEAPDLEDDASALEQLLPAPFARRGFPFAGFLATLYDHVAAQAERSLKP